MAYFIEFENGIKVEVEDIKNIDKTIERFIVDLKPLPLLKESKIIDKKDKNNIKYKIIEM